MSAPPKPWERTGINNQNVNNTMTGQMSSSPLPDTVIPDASQRVSTATQRVPPPVPTRPAQQRSLQGYSSYGSGLAGYSSYGGYSPYGGGMYGGGMYGGYNSYGGYGMNRFNNQLESGYGPNSFARQAEESSRQAFQSIESIVQAVGSVAMMLESSFYAVYNSFRAVIGVADHFSRMKMAFAQIFSALAVIRTLRWLYHKLLVLLRLRQDISADDIWTQAGEEGAIALTDPDAKGAGRSSWPIMLFFAIIIGGPWLIWRVLSSITGKKEGHEWYNGKDDHFRAVAEYDFEAEGEEELSFHRGQYITIAPKELQPKIRGWLLACVDGKQQGYIPANYVKVLGKRRGTRHLPKFSTGTSPSSSTSLPAPVLPSGDGEMNQAWSTQIMQTQHSHTSPTLFSEKIVNSVGDIQSNHSGLDANQNPPQYILSDTRNFNSVPEHSSADMIPVCSATSSDNPKSDVVTNTTSKNNMDKEDNK